MSSEARIENVQRNAVILTGLSFVILILLGVIYQVWFVSGAAAVAFALWITFSLAMRKNSPQWATFAFATITVFSYLLALYNITVWWLVPVVLCALTGWDLMHLHLRTTHLEIAQSPGKLNIILKQHYQRLGIISAIAVALVTITNTVSLSLPIGWVLLALVLAGVSLGSIFRWVRNHYG